MGWLNNLKVGDGVVVRSGFIRETRRLARVTKITPTQVVVGETRFRKKDGNSIGDDAYSRQSLQEATPERKAKVARERRRAQMLARLRDEQWGELSDETLERVVAVLDEPAPL